MQMNEIPSIGTTLTYGEAIKAYDRFERTMLEKAYGAGLLPAVGLYDLLWQLESLAQKFGIDGDKLASDLDEAFELFSKESAKVDVYADTYSPDQSERDSDRLGKDPFVKWVGIGFCVMMVCFGISMLVHSVFQIGFCSKWFI